MTQPKNELKKVLGAGFGIAVMVGGTIGVGILRTPGTIAGMLDSYWLILTCWIFRVACGKQPESEGMEVNHRYIVFALPL